MWVFVFIPGLLFLVAGAYEGIRALVERHRMIHPNINHLNFRRTGFGG